MTVTLTDEMRLILPSATGGIVTIIPKPRAAGEYTPAQRGALDAQLDAAEKTPLHGPFKNGKEIAAYLTTFQARRSVSPVVINGEHPASATGHCFELLRLVPFRYHLI